MRVSKGVWAEDAGGKLHWALGLLSGVEGAVLSFRPYTFGMPFQGVDDVDDVLLEILDSVHRRLTLVARLSVLRTFSRLGAMKHHRILMKVR